MRDILEDLEAGKLLSDPDPVRRAQIQMKAHLPKRFYATASVAKVDDGFAVHLDGKPVRTPGKALLALPTEPAARLVADEFAAQVEVIDPVKMPVLRIVNTAIDGVAATVDEVLEDVLRFATSDMLCYRADTPQALVDRQGRHWDPVLDWARTALGARFNLAEGIVHVDQPAGSIEALRLHLAGRAEPVRLAALHLMTSLTGSALLALAVESGALEAEAAWLAAHVDEDWQIEQWGQDAEAIARRNARHLDYLAAVSLLEATRR